MSKSNGTTSNQERKATSKNVILVGYDAKSFMHYRSYYFAIDNSKPTIESKVFSLIESLHFLLCEWYSIVSFQSNDFTTAELGAASELTSDDILLLRRMYGCGKFIKTL